MKTHIKKLTRTSILLIISIIGLLAVLAILPFGFESFAGGRDVSQTESSGKTISREDGIENYDIRTDKSKRDVLSEFRSLARKSAVEPAAVRDRFVAGENLLRRRVPTLKVEYNEDMRIPEVIAPDVEQGRAFLTSASKAKRADVLRQFISANDNLLGVEKTQVSQLVTTADYTNPDGNLSYAHLEQTINGYPVFRGEIKAGFTKDGKMFRVINNLAPGLDYAQLSTDFGDPFNAVKAAAANLNYELKDSELNQNYAASDDLKAVFGTGDWATTAEKMYFPTEPGAARTAWRVLVWKPTNAYYVIVDAETGTMLWRKNISADQTQPATYNVYANATNMLRTLNNPAPIVPGLNDPNSGTQGTLVPRSNVTLVGNEAPNTFNNLGWMTDNTNGANGTTDGNNVQAGLDIDGTDGVDATVNGTNRTFNFDYNPAPGNPAPGDAPTLPAYRNGAVTQLFYMTNRYHDELYKLGFTEAARNFQNNNFGRGGVANDRVSAEAQDSSGTNNANFFAPADGSRGRMQMFIFPGPNPDRDGDLDMDVVAHELTHGTSNRLIGNGSGLTTNRSQSMGEGWSDFYSLALLSKPSDPLAANYTTGGYVTYLLTSSYTYNYYYGIRRFPYAIKSFTGGPNNRPHNPLTFADIDPAQRNLSDGAYAANPRFASNSATEVHNAGEVWCSALWEVRGQLINRLGAANGNLKSLQLVTDGMKLTPNDPNFIQARDAIISAAAANSAADVIDVREGFRIRGMGFGAQDNGSAVVESYAVPNVELTDPFTVSDAPGNNNGFPESGENVLLNVPIINRTGATVNNVTVNVNGGTDVVYGSIAYNQTVTMQIPYTVPANTSCGSVVSVTINISSDAGTETPQMRSFRVGIPVFGSATQNFDGVTAPALPFAWTQTNSGANTGWVTATTNEVSAPNSVFAPDPTTRGEAILETSASINSANAQLSFSNRFDTETNYDGTVLEIKIGSGAYQDILAAGGSFASGGYTGALSSTTSLGTRQAWTGNSGGAVNTVVNLPAAANGQTIGLRWRTISDGADGGTGTYYDNMQLTGGNFLTSYTCTVTVTKTADTNDGVCDADCSLREAIATADAGDTVVFASPTFDSPQTININGQLTIDKNLTVTGKGANLLTVRNTAANSLVILIDNGGAVNLSGMTITGGNTSGLGGGISNNAGTLTLTGVHVTGNSAVRGAGIFNVNGTLTLTNSTISNNTAAGFDNPNGGTSGGIENLGGTMTITGSTISGNRVTGFNFNGGGIAANSGNNVTVTNSTITRNEAAGGGSAGGILIRSGVVSVRNSIVASNCAPGSNTVCAAGDPPDVGIVSSSSGGTFTSNGYNIIGRPGSVTAFNQTGDQTGTNSAPLDPRLYPLRDNGGRVPTHALRSNSPAVNTLPAEQQFVRLVGMGGTYTLTFRGQTTAAITACTGADQVAQALNNLSTIGGVGGSVTGFPIGNCGDLLYAITFGGTLAGADQPQITVTNNSTAGVFTGTVTEGANGAPASDQRNAPRVVGRADAGAFEFLPMVTNTNDTGAGSLRQTVADVPAGGFVIFEDDLFRNQQRVINLPSGQITINKSLSIVGTGANRLTVRNTAALSDTSRIFSFLAGGAATVNLSDLTVTGGNEDGLGGGIILAAGITSTLTNVVVAGNTAQGNGGGIFNRGTLTVIGSTVSNNTATSQSGGLGGGIENASTLTVINSTISGNTSTGGNFNGGGILNRTTASIYNSTVAFNQASGANSAGGILTGAPLTIRNSIIAANCTTGQQICINATTPDVFNAGGSYVSNGYNLIGNRGDVTAFNQTGDQTGTGAAQLDPLLAPLADNGGTTPTHALQPRSPAIDAGNCFGCSLDQRGLTRPLDFPNYSNASGGDGSDIGALELQLAPTAAAVSISGRVVTSDGRGLTNAQVVLTNQNGTVRTATTSSFGYFRFAEVAAGETVFISVRSKRFTFAPQVFSVTDDLSGIIFTGQTGSPKLFDSNGRYDDVK